jgi:hypothetical protein
MGKKSAGTQTITVPNQVVGAGGDRGAGGVCFSRRYCKPTSGRVAFMSVRNKAFAHAALLAMIGNTLAHDPRKCSEPPHIETPTVRVPPVSQVSLKASSPMPDAGQRTTVVLPPLFWAVLIIVAGLTIYFQYFSN